MAVRDVHRLENQKTSTRVTRPGSTSAATVFISVHFRKELQQIILLYGSISSQHASPPPVVLQGNRGLRNFETLLFVVGGVKPGPVGGVYTAVMRAQARHVAFAALSCTLDTSRLAVSAVPAFRKWKTECGGNGRRGTGDQTYATPESVSPEQASSFGHLCGGSRKHVNVEEVPISLSFATLVCLRYRQTAISTHTCTTQSAATTSFVRELTQMMDIGCTSVPNGSVCS